MSRDKKKKQVVQKDDLFGPGKPAEASPLEGEAQAVAVPVGWNASLNTRSQAGQRIDFNALRTLADGSPDLDGQIADREWLRREVPEWFERWGNIREMHHATAAGVGQELEEKDDGFYLKAHILDGGAWEKVKTGVYRGFSIGIKNPVVRGDMQAPGGRIVGGNIVEVSLVDHRANENARFLLVKNTSGETTPSPSPTGLPHLVGKITKPSEYTDVPDEDFADAVNWRYPANESNAEASIRVFNERDARYKGGYSRTQWARVGRRLAEMASDGLGKRYVFQIGRIIEAEAPVHESRAANVAKMANGELLQALAEPVKAMVAEVLRPLDIRLAKVEQMAAPPKAVLRAIDKTFVMQAGNASDEPNAKRVWLETLIADAKDETTRRYLVAELYKLSRQVL